MAGLPFLKKNKRFFLNQREMWWFPLVIFTAATLILINLTNFTQQHPSTIGAVILSAVGLIFPAENYLLGNYEAVQKWKIVNAPVGVATRSAISCGHFVGFIFFSYLDELSIAGVMMFYTAAATVLSAERLLMPITDFGLFVYLVGCAVSQSFRFFSRGVWFLIFLVFGWSSSSSVGFFPP